MSISRYRGLFWSPEGEPAPGALEISDSGDLHVEVQGELFENGGRWEEPEEPVRIEGEIADSPFPGPAVTLFRCLRTQKQFGGGGSLEKWLAHRALIGNNIVEPDKLFERVTIRTRGLAAFVGRTPPLGRTDSRVLQLPDFRIEEKQFAVADWKVIFGWTTRRRGDATSFQVSRSPFIEIALEHLRSVDQVLQDIVPVFEALLTIALQGHDRIEEITVSSSQERDAYRVLGPRVEAALSKSKREPYESELLFSLADMAERPSIIDRVRGLFSRLPEFTAIFLGHERAPPRYMEDHVRVSVLTLAHLTNLFPAISERATQWLDSLGKVPVQLQSFLPSAALVAVPELARELLTPALCRAFGVTSTEEFAQSIGPAFRWATLREGTPSSGRDLLRLHHQLRALLHLALLRYLGFEPEEAERRMVHAIERAAWLPPVSRSTKT
jgi:hypothetical protein